MIDVAVTALPGTILTIVPGARVLCDSGHRLSINTGSTAGAKALAAFHIFLWSCDESIQP